jgi:hypothetical protein
MQMIEGFFFLFLTNIDSGDSLYGITIQSFILFAMDANETKAINICFIG